MPTLILDTSLATAEIAIYDNGKFLKKKNSKTNSHIEELDSLVDEVLHLANRSLEDISRIIIGSGPGSFTGLRIGYSYAIGLASGLKIPLIKHNTSKAITYKFYEKYKLVLTLLDARRNEYFASFYLNKDQTNDFSELESLIHNNILSREEVLTEIKMFQDQYQISNSEILIISDQIFDSKYMNSTEISIVEGLLEQDKTNKLKDYNLLEISTLEPDYVRAVSALKICER